MEFNFYTDPPRLRGADRDEAVSELLQRIQFCEDDYDDALYEIEEAIRRRAEEEELYDLRHEAERLSELHDELWDALAAI